MTTNQFLAALKRLTKSGHRTWIVPKGSITSIEDELCPINEVWLASKVGRTKGMLEDWGEEADSLGLKPIVAQKIVIASDGKGYPALRKKLLTACNLVVQS